MNKQTENAIRFAVELDPPATADAGRFLSGARELWEQQADMITLADCPFGMPTMDSILLACKLQREYGITALPHLACRDRNFNAIQAALMGLSAEKVGQVLLVTGDPIPLERRSLIKSVFNGNSRELIRFAASLNETVLAENPLRFFAALNVNAVNFSHELRLAQEKEASGAVGFFTQPVLTKEALENLMAAREALSAELWGGIMPIVSERNARYLATSVSGIRVDGKIIEAYAGADRVRGEDLATEISTKAAGSMLPYTDGIYLMTPFGRTGLVCRIMESIRALR